MSAFDKLTEHTTGHAPVSQPGSEWADSLPGPDTSRMNTAVVQSLGQNALQTSMVQNPFEPSPDIPPFKPASGSIIDTDWFTTPNFKK